ncbi:MAG TPA: RNA polymerase sigma factor [Acidobacteriaceae bacterium]
MEPHGPPLRISPSMSLAGVLPWGGGAGVGSERPQPAQPKGNAARRGALALNSLNPPSSFTPAPKRHDVAETDWLALVKRCLDGDNLAWTELVRAQHKRVYALCYRFTGSAHDAEDLTQDVFIKIYGNLRTFDLAKGSFQTWLTTLTRNLLVDHFRRTRQQRVTDSMDAGWDNADDPKFPDPTADPRSSPHDAAVRKELERMVQAALSKVSPELREAVILRDLQDMDYKEISQVLRIPEGTVKSRISRGRAELARLLERNKRQVV